MIRNFASGNVVLEFGTGDINVLPGVMGNQGVLAFRNQGPREIGLDNGDSIENVSFIKLPVKMTFDKVESIDIIIHSLNQIKDLMKRAKE